MRELRTMFWKEWRETRLFLVIAWALFIGLPIIGGIQARGHYAKYKAFEAEPWVVAGGFILAVFVGVAGTCRDLQAKLEDFWQSRPIGAIRLFCVKFIVGAIVLLLACEVPLLLQKCSTTPLNGGVMVMLWTAAQVTVIYAVAFAAGCVLRRPANAAAVAVVGVLVMYCVPVVFPPLERFNLWSILDPSPGAVGTRESFATWPLVNFAVAVFAVISAMTMVGLLAVKLHWRIESTRPLMYGTVSAAFLLMLGSASYLLGTDLPVLDSISFDNYYFHTSELSPQKFTATLWATRWDPAIPQSRSQQQVDIAIADRSISLVSSKTVKSFWHEHRPESEQIEWNRPDPSVLYSVEDEKYGRSVDYTLTVSRPDSTTVDVPSNILLWTGAAKEKCNAYLHVNGDRLWVFGKRTIVFDISSPEKLVKISDEPIVYEPNFLTWREPPYVVTLPPDADWSPKEKLDFAMSIERESAFDGSRWCVVPGPDEQLRGNSLEMLRLKTLTNTEARFEKVAVYKPTMISGLFGLGNFDQLKLEGDRLYGVSNGYQLSVFDLSKPPVIRLMSHFATAQGILTIAPLPDGRVIAAGSKIFLLGAPRR